MSICADKQHSDQEQYMLCVMLQSPFPSSKWVTISDHIFRVGHTKWQIVSERHFKNHFQTYNFRIMF